MSRRGFLFNKVPIPKWPSNWFDLGFENKFTQRFGELTPVCCHEVIPGDRAKAKITFLTRLLANMAPVMHRINYTVDFFFVRNQDLWPSWDDAISPGNGKVKLSDAKNYVPPEMPWVNAGLQGSSWADQTTLSSSSARLGDFLGVPPSTPGDLKVSALPFAAYQKIWNDYYRDQNLMDDISDDIILTDGRQIGSKHLTELTKIRYRCYGKDYFTSALPEPQRGEDVPLPMVGPTEGKIKDLVSVPNDVRFNNSLICVDGVIYTKNRFVSQLGSDDPDYYSNLFDVIISDFNTAVNNYKTPPLAAVSRNESNSGYLVGADALADSIHLVGRDVRPVFNNKTSAMSSSGSGSLGTVEIQPSSSTVTINDLRIAEKLQQFFELSARVGSRVVETIRGFFGVVPPDATNHRPEFLGRMSSPITFSEVLQTSETTSGGALGTQGGHGVSAGNKFLFDRKFTEHGFIIGVASIVPFTGYMQGLPRMFSRETYLDYAWPIFSRLGEQVVKNKEIYAHSANPEGTFGYQSRYSEYKYHPDEVHGAFRNEFSYWHLARIFENEPTLNEDFVMCKPDSFTIPGTELNGGLNRIFTEIGNNAEPFLVDMYIDLNVKRKLDKYGIPIL